jgi:(4-alkanoyl-5-oxo-2,5-dihydrofuran-3-yl)methyl phosphate reductase
MSKPLILVTGATGTIGSELVPQLVAQGERVRVLTRDAEKARKFGPSVEVVEADLEKPQTLGPAFAGVDELFVLSNFPTILEQETNAYAAAKAAGVKHIVKLSGRHTGADFFAATPLAGWHRDSEQRLQSLGIPWTILRPGFWASNMLLLTDRQNRTITMNCGEGRESFLDPADIAACAAKLLTTPGHDGRIYEITGSEALTYSEIAEKLTAASGKPVTYQDVPDDGLRRGFLSAGFWPPMVESFIAMFAAVREGKVYPPTNTVAELLGRPPRSFDDWARANAAAFA